MAAAARTWVAHTVAAFFILVAGICAVEGTALSNVAAGQGVDAPHRSGSRASMLRLSVDPSGAASTTRARSHGTADASLAPGFTAGDAVDEESHEETDEVDGSSLLDGNGELDSSSVLEETAEVGSSSLLEETDEADKSDGKQTIGRRRRRVIHFNMVASYSYDFNGSFYDDIIDLTNSARMSGAVSIEFTARWDAFNRWSRILDFGSGPREDNVIVSNGAEPGELAFYIYSGHTAKGMKIPNAIRLGVPATYLLTISGVGHMKVWKDGKIIGQTDDGFAPRAVAREHLYIGKSNWQSTPLFKGMIKDFYIWSGEAEQWGTRDKGFM